MRAGWKVIGGAAIAGTAFFAIILGHSRVSSGDTASAGSPDADVNGPSSSGVVLPHDPSKPYPLGPHAIPYEEAGAEAQAAIEAIQETVETSQPASSYAAWSTATAWTGQQAEAEIAARGVGLVGTDSDGVIP
jgi:hypothetical protein